MALACAPTSRSAPTLAAMSERLKGNQRSFDLVCRGGRRSAGRERFALGEPMSRYPAVTIAAAQLDS
jgi:hypothetical protein